jgi:hypothetical protein
MGRQRKVTIVFNDMEDGEYNEVANAIWSVAHLTRKLDHVKQDAHASSDDLNRWYDEAGREVRWGDA